MLNKQSKTLSEAQVKAVLSYIEKTRNPKRNLVIFLLSMKAGLRAKEIAYLTWQMVLESENHKVGNTLDLTNKASKGKGSGRVIPLNKDLKIALDAYYSTEKLKKDFNSKIDYVIKTERASRTSAQVMVNLFKNWYSNLGFIGCSSHSGRRTFITNTARKISLVGGSLRDIQNLAGHASINSTQRYIESNNKAQQRVVNLI